MISSVDARRIITHKQEDRKDGLVVYHMVRDMRVQDNWALLFAREYAETRKCGLAVAFVLDPRQPHANRRRLSFLLAGLQLLQQDLERVGIPLVVLDAGESPDAFEKFVHTHRVSAVVSDFCPLRHHRHRMAEISRIPGISHYEVDAHNIVPCVHVSKKAEFGAYTLRPKIRKVLHEFLTEFPALPPQHPGISGKPALPRPDWNRLAAIANAAGPPEPVGWLDAGEAQAALMLDRFLREKLHRYDTDRNRPEADGQSNLSPYLHFGHIAPQRVALEVARQEDSPGKTAFLEELIVRRELADNFCHYNPGYDSPAGFPQWARRDIEQHRADARPYIYTLEEFEAARTHDRLWNAAQNELLQRGKIHGYLRMYWAKKILEWTPSVEEAMAVAVRLNDAYSLDGCDPNGYAGIAWSIGGVHDRAWFPRPIFGKIRYMSHSGCKSKFDVEAYMRRYDPASGRKPHDD